MLSALFSCASPDKKPYTAKQNQEWLQPILKPGYVIWVSNGESNDNFVLVEASNKGLIGENIQIPYSEIKHISWKTPEQAKSYCKENTDKCEAHWFLGSILMWLPILL